MPTTKTRINKIATVIVPVSDQERAIEFYVKTLGFQRRGHGAWWRGGTPAARAGQGVAQDLADDGPELLRQPTAVVRQAVARADLPHLRGDLRVTVCRQVGEHVVLDLVAQVAGQNVE